MFLSCFECVSGLHILLLFCRFRFNVLLFNDNLFGLGCKCGKKKDERIIGGADADVSINN